MSSSHNGENTSPTASAAANKAEVINVTAEGFYMTVNGEGFFLSFERYPWFDNAPVRLIFAVEMLDEDHLRWDTLDVDLELDSLRHPEKYPLIFDPEAATRLRQIAAENLQRSLLKSNDEIWQALRELADASGGMSETIAEMWMAIRESGVLAQHGPKGDG